MSELGFNAQVLKDMRDACAICIDSYESDTSGVFVGLITHCGHYFHFECLWNWLEINQTCPICRVRCDLAETDIRGLSLQQVLALVPSDTSQSGSLSNVSGTVQMVPIASPEEGASEAEAHAQPSCAPAGDYHSDSDSSCDVSRRAHIVTVASVVTSQPRPVSRNNSDSSSRSRDVSTSIGATDTSHLPPTDSAGLSNPSYD